MGSVAPQSRWTCRITMQDMSRVLVALPASARSFSLNPPIWPLKPLVWPGQEAISAAEAVHLLGATPCNCQRAPDLRGHRRTRGVSVDSGLGRPKVISARHAAALATAVLLNAHRLLGVRPRSHPGRPQEDSRASSIGWRPLGPVSDGAPAAPPIPLARRWSMACSRW